MSDEKKPKKWPVGPATLLTIVASIVAEVNFFHEMLEAQVTTLGRTLSDRNFTSREHERIRVRLRPSGTPRGNAVR